MSVDGQPSDQAWAALAAEKEHGRPDDVQEDLPVDAALTDKEVERAETPTESPALEGRTLSRPASSQSSSSKRWSKLDRGCSGDCGYRNAGDHCHTPGHGGNDKQDDDDDYDDADGQEDKMSRTRSEQSVAGTLSLPHEMAFIAIVCMAQFMTQAGLGQGLALLHVIGEAFDITNPGELSWIIAGYSLTVGTFILFSGRLGDLFGYKRMFVIGFCWFSVWSMICGVAVYSNHVLFIFARVLQGIGPAIVLPNGLAILGASYSPGMRKNMVFSIFGATAPGGSVVGSAMASVLNLAWWPWAFWAQAIALSVVAILAYLIIPEPPTKAEQERPLKEKLKEMDLPGAVIGIVALVLVNFAWNQAPFVGWQKAYVYVILIIGILLIPAFFYIEMRVAKVPLIPFDALNSSVSFVLGCVACGWASFGIWVYYYWQILNELRGTSPLLTTAYISPVAISGAFAAVLTGFILGRIGPAWTMTCAMTAFLTGSILLATVPVHQTYWAQFFVTTLVTPFGMDMSFPAATVILSNSVSKKHQGIAASLVNTVVNYSISLGLGFAGTIEVHVNHGGLTPADVLKGYRSTLYFGIGLASLGILVSLSFVVKSHFLNPRDGRLSDSASS